MKKKLCSIALALILIIGTFSAPKAFASTAPYVQSDTTVSFSRPQGLTYQVKFTVHGAHSDPHIAAGDGNVLQTLNTVKTKDSSGNDVYLFKVKAIGAAGTSSAIYTTLPGQSAVRHFVLTVAAAPGSYSVGQKVTVNSSEGQYSVTIDSVKSGASINEYADTQPKRIILINYSFENISCKQDMAVYDYSFHVYDASGKLLETYPSTDASGPSSTISAGKHSSASVAYGLDNSSNQITLELYDTFDFDKHIATYNINVQ